MAGQTRATRQEVGLSYNLLQRTHFLHLDNDSKGSTVSQKWHQLGELDIQT